MNTIPQIDDVCTIDHAEPYRPTPEDLREYGDWLAMTEAAFHDVDEPTPVEALGEPWSSWPDWTDERWELAEPEAFGLPRGADRDPRRRPAGFSPEADRFTI